MLTHNIKIYDNMCMSLDEAGQDNEDDAIDMVVESPISWEGWDYPFITFVFIFPWLISKVFHCCVGMWGALLIAKVIVICMRF